MGIVNCIKRVGYIIVLATTISCGLIGYLVKQGKALLGTIFGEIARS